ncbi:MAG TPA: CopD family protein [Acetobacteraceae bacterium]|nr:CopD family protein [Acetobacteraceae bacterium]
MEMTGPPIWLTLLRGCHDAAILSLLGALAFTPCVLARDLAPRMALPLRRVAGLSGAIALGLGIAWFLGETAQVAGSDGIAATLDAVPDFVAYLQFGQVLLGRLVLIALTLALLGRPPIALASATAAVALQPWLGHAAQVGGGLAASEALHLLAAGLWLGGLIPLLLCLGALPAPDAARACRRFTWPGLAAVLTLAGTGPAQGLTLAGGAPGLIGTAYGRIILLKSALFALALAFAARNALVLTPALARHPAASRALAGSVSVEAVVGTAIVLAAGWLAELSPGGG